MRQVLLLVLGFFIFAAISIHAEEASPPTTRMENAHVTYKDSYSTSPPGVYENGEILFAIVEFAVEGRSEDAMEARAVFALRDALRNYAAEHYTSAETPPEPVLLSLFPKLLPLLQTVNPELGVFPLNYNGPLRELVDEKRGEKYRYAVALPKDKLESSLPVVRHAVPEDIAVERALQALWKRLERRNQLAILCNTLSLPEDRLRIANVELCRSLNADSLCWGVVSPHRLYAAHSRFAKLGDRPSLESLAAVSDGLPISSCSLAVWADSDDVTSWNSLNAYLLALADKDNRDAMLNRLSVSTDDSTKEYSAWLSQLAVKPWPELLHDVTPGPVVVASWSTMGHANFPEHTPAAETPEYREAKQLFDAGQELPRLTELLLRSLEISPRHAPSWTLLGNALRAADAQQDAVWPLMQALRLTPDSSETRASLALVYHAANRKEWAIGMAASVLAFPEASEWSRKKALEILDSAAPKSVTP